LNKDIWLIYYIKKFWYSYQSQTLENSFLENVRVIKKEEAVFLKNEKINNQREYDQNDPDSVDNFPQFLSLWKDLKRSFNLIYILPFSEGWTNIDEVSWNWKRNQLIYLNKFWLISWSRVKKRNYSIFSSLKIHEFSISFSEMKLEDWIKSAFQKIYCSWNHKYMWSSRF
jgi:hypothetical protein